MNCAFWILTAPWLVGVPGDEMAGPGCATSGEVVEAGGATYGAELKHPLYRSFGQRLARLRETRHYFFHGPRPGNEPSNQELLRGLHRGGPDAECAPGDPVGVPGTQPLMPIAPAGVSTAPTHAGIRAW